MEFSGTPNIGIPFPYYSHTTPIRIPKDMGIVWEAYHKRVPLVGVPEITLDLKLPPPPRAAILVYNIVMIGFLWGWNRTSKCKTQMLLAA